MAKLYSGFWVGVTILLSVVFIVLFFPVAHSKYSLPESIILTGIGVTVIWLSYLVRAYVFSAGTTDATDKEKTEVER